MREGTLGITVMPEWFQTEGIEPVLDNLAAAGATALATSPYVLAPAPEGEGGREPPIDGGAGEVRLLDRPLFGRRALWVRTAPAFRPDPRLYVGLRYRPATPDALTEAEAPRIQAAIRAAKDRGLTVHLQVQAAIPPGYRVQFGGGLADEDQPLLPDGTKLPGRVDGNGSLAAPAIRDYLAALLADLAQAFPDVDAIRLDWPEYPPYALEATLFDFSAAAMRFAAGQGFDTARMRADALAALTAIRDGSAAALLRDGSAREWLAARPGLADLARCKAALAADFIATAAAALHAASGGRIALVPQGFPAPFARASGFDPALLAPLVPAMGIKLYTMHWPMILRFWARSLGAPDDPALLLALAAALDLTDGPVDPARLVYPAPDAPHPVGVGAQRRKILAARAAAGTTPIFAMAHSYGPVEDVAARFRLAWEASARRVFVNRYGYMDAAKIAAIGAILREPWGG